MVAKGALMLKALGELGVYHLQPKALLLYLLQELLGGVREPLGEAREVMKRVSELP